MVQIQVTPLNCVDQLRNRFPESEECWLKESQVCKKLVSHLRNIHVHQHLPFCFVQIKGFFSRYKKAAASAQASSISVAVIDSVEMDNEEEDAMLEAIQIDAFEENVEAATSQ